MNSSALCASLCATAALASTWSADAGGAPQPTDTFQLGVHFIEPGTTLYTREG